MRVIDEFKGYFDGTRDLKKAAARLMKQRLYEAKLIALDEDIQAIANAKPIQDFRAAVDGLARTVVPNSIMDPAGAYWFRKGLEQAVLMLDQTLATAGEDTND